MNTSRKIITVFFSLLLLFFTLSAKAGIPVWKFTPLTATTITVPANGTVTVQYQITNQSTRTHTLAMQPITGITQLTGGLGICGNPFVLTGNASCTLSLQVDGSLLTHPISDGPIVCEQGSPHQCYRPGLNDLLHITPGTPISDAMITVTDSPLTLIANGPDGTLTINNTSLDVTATGITSDFTGTALDGNVTETSNTCASLAPMSSCTLGYTPGGTAVPQTNFTIQGSNTNAITAAIQINSITLTNVSPASGSASGGTGVTLTGTGLTGATAVTFGGVAATSVHVVNSTTVTAVTPAHAVGAVNVSITVPSGTAALTNGYTYVATAVGQSAFGGVIACLNGGLNNLIAATADNSTGIAWGGQGITTGATSITDGAANTTTIVNALGANGGVPYAAQLCSNYAVDSQGNTPCQAGNTCYTDWFLPAGNNTTASGQLFCLFTNQVAIGGFVNTNYLSSTEANSIAAYYQDFVGGSGGIAKAVAVRVRCVRAFTP